jgi:hypothetical protein
MADEQITILIPTCQRANVLPYALATCLSQEDRNCTILVSDNASEDETPTVIARAAARDPRVRSIRAARRLGMTEHWEFALSHITDGWVVIIGDDDGLLPRALPNLRQAAARHPDIEAIGWPYSFYIYPDPAKSVQASGLLAIGQAAEEHVRDSRQWLRKLANFRSAYYTELPQAYHGMVHTRLLERIRTQGGRQIATRIPDVYLAVAMASACGRYLRMQTSQSLFGSSPHSNGASSQGQGDPKIYERFNADSTVGQHPSVPSMRSISSLILEALLTCRDSGLLPRDVSIDFETAFVRTFIENAALPQPDDAATVGRLAAAIGQEQTFLKLGAMEPTELSPLRAELSSTGWMPTFRWCVNILATSNVQDVDGAVRIAEMIYTDPQAREALLPPPPPPPPPPAPVAPQPVPPSIEVRETRSLADAISTIAGKIVREIARPFKTLHWG